MGSFNPYEFTCDTCKAKPGSPCTYLFTYQNLKNDLIKFKNMKEGLVGLYTYRPHRSRTRQARMANLDLAKKSELAKLRTWFDLYGDIFKEQ